MQPANVDFVPVQHEPVPHLGLEPCRQRLAALGHIKWVVVGGQRHQRLGRALQPLGQSLDAVVGEWRLRTVIV